MTISICNSEMEQIGVVKPGDTGAFETPSGRQLNVLSQGWGKGFEEGRGFLGRIGIRPILREYDDVVQITDGFLVGI